MRKKIFLEKISAIILLLLFLLPTTAIDQLFKKRALRLPDDKARPSENPSFRI